MPFLWGHDRRARADHARPGARALPAAADGLPGLTQATNAVMRSTSLIYILEAPSFSVRGAADARASYRSIADVRQRLVDYADDLELRCCIRYCGTETKLLASIQEAGNVASALIVNAGRYASTSTALRAALSTLQLPIIEVQLGTSDHSGRAAASLIPDVVTGAIHGLGVIGYELALDALAALWRDRHRDAPRRLVLRRFPDEGSTPAPSVCGGRVCPGTGSGERQAQAHGRRARNVDWDTAAHDFLDVLPSTESVRDDRE